MAGEKQPTTSEILKKLMATTSIKRFVKQHNDAMAGFPSFSRYIKTLYAGQTLTAENIFNAAHIERTYGHQLFNGTRTPSRDKVLQLAFGFGLDIDGTQRMLTVARKSPLHPKVKRDAVVIYALKKQLHLDEVQVILQEMKLPLLGKERNNG